MSLISREQLLAQYKEKMVDMVDTDIGMTWVVKARQISLTSRKEMREQTAMWKLMAHREKGRVVKAFDYNNKEFVVEGVKWYVLIAQFYKDDELEEDANIMCPLSLMLFGTMVNGLTYAFESEKARNFWFNCINAKVRLCDLCLDPCECAYGHNPAPLLDKTKRVCGKCNAEEVIPARMAIRKAMKEMELAEKEKVAAETATELLNSTDAEVAPPKQEKVKTKAELKKEQTKNANKAKAEEKKAKEEYERLAAIAYAKTQADKKKKAREIAIKKQKAWLKEGEKLLAEMEKLEGEDV